MSRGDRAVGLVALALALALWFAGLRGVDYPAQIYRVDLFRRYGLTLWNANWYGGHYIPGYGIVFPWLASFTGLAIPAIGSTVSSVVLLGRLMRRCGLPHVIAGTSVFAFLMLVNLYEGRLPFALGLMFGLITVRFALTSRWLFAAATALLTSLSSPLAGGFLALVLVAWIVARMRSHGLGAVAHPLTALVGVCVTPPIILGILFPEGGIFPYRGGEMVLLVVLCAIACALIPPSLAAVRWACAAAGTLAIPLYIVPNPVGGNLNRLVLIGAPVLASASLRNRKVQVMVVAAMLVWQAKPLRVLPNQATDPAANESYHAPLIAAVEALSDGPVRIEIPFTEGHWEAAYVADQLALARGWERQLDYRFNSVLYDSSLDQDSYQRWLYDHGVSYVAIADARLETTARREAALAASAPYLRMVWHNEHWRLYSVDDSPGLLTGDAKLLRLDTNMVRIDARSPGPMTLRVRFNPYLAVSNNAGCTSEADGGWTTVTSYATGPIELTTSLDVDQSARCR